MVAVHRRIQKFFRVQSVQQNPISQMPPFHYPFLRTPAINSNSFPSSLNMLCCSGCVSGDSGEGVWLIRRGNITAPLCIGQKVLKDSYRVTGSQLLVCSCMLVRGCYCCSVPSCVQLFVTPWAAAHQAALSSTTSQSLLKLMSIESVMPSNHFILCHPCLFLPSIFPSIRVFSNELALHTRWSKYWNFSISPSNKYSGLISFGTDWFDLLAA